MSFFLLLSFQLYFLTFIVIYRNNFVTIKRCSFAEFINFRNERSSEDTLRFEPPGRPFPSADEEIKFWKDEVLSGNYLIYSIYDINEDPVGFISAFSFDKSKRECESGIVIFPKSNWNKGYAFNAYKLFFDILKYRYSIISVFICTTLINKSSIKLFEKLGFKKSNEYDDAGMRWIKMILFL